MLWGCSGPKAVPSTEQLDAPLLTAPAPAGCKVRACKQEWIMAPLDRSWDTFLLDGSIMSEIFPVERAPQEQAERIAF